MVSFGRLHSVATSAGARFPVLLLADYAYVLIKLIDNEYDDEYDNDVISTLEISTRS